jgi:hypothetical protein
MFWQRALPPTVRLKRKPRMWTRAPSACVPPAVTLNNIQQDVDVTLKTCILEVLGSNLGQELAILTESFCNSLQTLQAYTARVHWLSHDGFLPDPPQFMTDAMQWSTWQSRCWKGPYTARTDFTYHVHMLHSLNTRYTGHTRLRKPIHALRSVSTCCIVYTHVIQPRHTLHSLYTDKMK